MTDQHDKRPEETLKDAADVVAETGGNFVYALIAFFATNIVAQSAFDLPHDSALEVSMLNAGLAYYSHAATGRVLRAMLTIVRSRRRSVSYHPATQRVEEDKD